MGSLIEDIGAGFSPDRKYRYLLWRIWDPGRRYLAAIGMNPSYADEERNDSTVTILRRRAAQMGFGGLYMLNVCPYRETHPEKIPMDDTRWGPDGTSDENDKAIARVATDAGMVLACWGSHILIRDRAQEVRAALAAMGVTLYTLGLTHGGHPRHPLRVPYATQPLPWGS
jgi:hypothetical protein